MELAALNETRWREISLACPTSGEIACSTQLHGRPNVLRDYILITSPLMAELRMELGKSCLRCEFVPIASIIIGHRLHLLLSVGRNRCSKFPKWLCHAQLMETVSAYLIRLQENLCKVIQEPRRPEKISICPLKNRCNRDATASQQSRELYVDTGNRISKVTVCKDFVREGCL
ncbi:uncharacterized protein TNCV_10621 [Trichonephila clavipes]|nr:uncharacterized protein TNCV_10621 [Trichonephila clavipes]